MVLRHHALACNDIIFKRYSSSINNKSIYVIALPITTQKSYIYCHHKPSILAPNHRNKFPIITKLENKALGLVHKGWHKLSSSKFIVNVKVTQFARKIVDSIHYEETSLRSFPSKASMIREIDQQETQELESTHNTLIQKQIDDLKIPESQIKPIPLYHPQFMNANSILSQLYRFRDDSYSAHLKYTILCGLGIPLSLPFALVPIIPNIPGFYFAYRFYCNIKALLGIKHLEYLLQGFNNDDPSIGSNRLRFEAINDIDKIYQQSPPPSTTKLETLVITADIIEDLTRHLNLPELKDGLTKALAQETRRLNQPH